MAIWSKPTKILVFVIILAAIIAAAWFYVRWQQSTEQSDPQEILKELTLGDALDLENTVQGLDPTKEELRVYEVAPNQEVAQREGLRLIMSRSAVIDYYEQWFKDNNWSMTYSREAIPGMHDILARKDGQGLLKISITGLEEDALSVITVSIMYGYGR